MNSAHLPHRRPLSAPDTSSDAKSCAPPALRPVPSRGAPPARPGFEHLPADWPSRSLADPRLAAGVVDLCVPVRERHARCLCILLCDGANRLVQPCLVADVPRVSGDLDKLRLLKPFAQVARDCGGGLLIARGRSGGLDLDVEDVAWARVARHACRIRSVELIGAWLATPRGVVSIDPGAHLAA